MKDSAMQRKIVWDCRQAKRLVELDLVGVVCV